MDDTVFTRELFEQQHVTVVPGSYLSREVDGENPGANRVRMALVAPLAECVEAAGRIRDYLRRAEACAEKRKGIAAAIPFRSHPAGEAIGQPAFPAGPARAGYRPGSRRRSR